MDPNLRSIVQMALEKARETGLDFEDPSQLSEHLEKKWYLNPETLARNKDFLLNKFMEHKHNPPSPPHTDEPAKSPESQRRGAKPTLDEEQPKDLYVKVFLPESGRLDMMYGSYCKEKESYISRVWLSGNKLSAGEDGTIMLRCVLDTDEPPGRITFRSRFVAIEDKELERDCMLGTAYREDIGNGSSRDEGSVSSPSVNGEDRINPIEQFLREPEIPSLDIIQPGPNYHDAVSIAAKMTAEISTIFAQQRQQQSGSEPRPGYPGRPSFSGRQT